jgi:hypothetical protein
MVRSTTLPIQGTKEWIFYIFGWITGITSLLFWVIMLLLYAIVDKGGPFFNNAFHRRVLIWGYVMGIIYAVLLLLVLFLFVVLGSFATTLKFA